VQGTQDVTIQFLREHGYDDSQITEYYDILARFRKRFHPSGQLAPDPKEYYITAPDGAKIFVQEFIPENARAIVMGQPGNNCQGDLYYPLADHLYYKGIGVIAVDNRGHGRSGPERGWFDHPEWMFPVYDSILQRFQGLPRHLLGESLGSAMLAAYLASSSKMARDVSSAILMVAPFRARFHVLTDPILSRPMSFPLILLLFILRIFSTDRPFLALRPDFRPTYYHEYHKIDQMDIIRAPKISAVFIYNLARMFAKMSRNAMKIRKPVLLLLGTGDQLVDPYGTLEFFKNAIHIHRKIHVFKNADHSLMFDKNSQKSYDIITSWIEGDWQGKKS